MRTKRDREHRRESNWLPVVARRFSLASLRRLRILGGKQLLWRFRMILEPESCPRLRILQLWRSECFRRALIGTLGSTPTEIRGVNKVIHQTSCPPLGFRIPDTSGNKVPFRSFNIAFANPCPFAIETSEFQLRRPVILCRSF